MDKRPIGIFDSGIGGLTVLKEISKALPREDIVYFGDTARVPYGNKSRSTVIRFSIQNCGFLLNKGVKIIVVACNTASSLALARLRKNFDIPLFGVVASGAAAALKASSGGRIAVLGTRATINSLSYEQAIKKKNNKACVYSQACPLFVPLVEEGLMNSKVAREAIRLYLAGIKRRRPDTAILACTHYPLLRRQISSYLKGVNIIDSARAVADKVKSELTKNDLLHLKSGPAKCEFYVSDEPLGFRHWAKVFLKKDIKRPKVVDV